ncbi:MAG: hypothetical protein KF746_20155 [Chitinophagaceae bacterium]|nr:hypothetical protein [Chitinophagaceae bacterium]
MNIFFIFSAMQVIYLYAMLEIPITARVPEAWELPHRPDIEELLLKRQKALIMEGYKLTESNNAKVPYTFQAEININNSKLWHLITELATLLPPEIVLEYSFNDEATYLTEPVSKAEALQTLSRFETELTGDCALAFSLSSHTAQGLTEIIITSSKYIRFSGNDKSLFSNIMKNFALNEIPALAFIDEYPQIIEPLKKFIPSSRRPEDVIWSLNRAFNIES